MISLCLEKCCCCPQTLADNYTVVGDLGSIMATPATAPSMTRIGRCFWRGYADAAAKPAGVTTWPDDVYILTRYKPRPIGGPSTITCIWAVAKFMYPIGSSPEIPILTDDEDWWMFADAVPGNYVPALSVPLTLQLDETTTPWLPPGPYTPENDVNVYEDAGP